MLRGLLASPYQHHAAPEPRRERSVRIPRPPSRPHIVLAIHLRPVLNGAGRLFNEEQVTQD